MADAGDPAAHVRRRSWVARIAAPLALVAAIAAVALIISGSLGSDDEPATAGSGDGSAKTEGSGGSESEKSPVEEEGEDDLPETYEVQSGDSLSTIAAEFGMSVEKLQRLNPDADTTALSTGQILKLR